MKKFILTCLLTLSNAVAFAFSGSGTEADPYLIKTADDLYLIRNTPTAYYKLANDIDLTEWIADNYPEAGWAPICSSASPFTGTLDGDSHTIRNLFINRTTDYTALIAYAKNATVKNLNVECDIIGAKYTSAIIGGGNGFIVSECLVKGKVSGSDSYTGGVIGLSHSFTLQRCAVEADIYGKNYVGGLVGGDGSSYSSNVINCYYDGNISGSSYVGSICGNANSINIIRCMTSGTVTGNDRVGGIIGYFNAGTIESNVCLCTTIKGNSYVHRVVGSRNSGSIGSFGSNTENKVISTCNVFIGDNLQVSKDGDYDGYAISAAALQRAQTYTAITWDFTDVWGIDEGKGFPYLRFRKALQAEATTDSEENVTFNFTLPTELTPAVTPSDEEDSGVNITTNTFTNNDVTVSFGLGTRTQSFAARLWTNDDLSTGLRIYKDGTMTIATSSDNLITRIALTGDDTSTLTANVGTISGGTWTGEASSVIFTAGASYNKINTIDVTYKHAILALTDVAPAIMKGTYEPGKVKYSRVSGGDYASFCLPFDIDLSEATGIETVYMPMEQIIYNTETEWLMMFLDEQDMTSTVKAGTPFLAKTSDSEVTFSNSKRVSFSQPLSENPVAKTLKVFNFDGHSGVLYKNNTLGVTWGGTYVPTEATEGLNSFNINGSFGQHTGTLNAYRAYVMQTSTAASRVRGIQLNLAGDEGEVTSVFQLLNEPAATEGIYDMTGRRVLNTQQGGLYIINGKKVVK